MKFDFSDLVDQKLVTRKDIGNGLYLYKYARKVFYDNLWHLDSRLLEARGIVLDAKGNVVVWPFTKVFNRFENGTDVDRDQTIVAIRKVNGFMACATRHPSRGLLVSTTGSSDSEFAELARGYIDTLDKALMDVNTTYIFEVCDPSDPHIVEEKQGIYLIGMRNLYTGKMEEEWKLDDHAKYIRARRPEHGVMRFSELTDLVKTVDHEGFMVRSLTGETLMKIKSPHYLSKKALMRMGKRAADQMFDNPKKFRERLDEEFYGLFQVILDCYTKEEWLAMGEQERRQWIETYKWILE